MPHLLTFLSHHHLTLIHRISALLDEYRNLFAIESFFFRKQNEQSCCGRLSFSEPACSFYWACSVAGSHTQRTCSNNFSFSNRPQPTRSARFSFSNHPQPIRSGSFSFSENTQPTCSHSYSLSNRPLQLRSDIFYLSKLPQPTRSDIFYLSKHAQPYFFN